MRINLLEITTDELLEKFGAGSHKPGSGSAAAFQGMLSAKLLVTVISLTIDIKRRSKYKEAYPTLVEMDTRIKERIFPELTRLFNEDAIQFGKTINAREERNREKDPFENHKLARLALKELKESIEIPLNIGKLCIELADIAKFVFDKGFQSARGDSQVALSGSVAGIAGCLSIIQLNFLSFGSDWTSKKNEEAKKLKSEYTRVLKIADKKIETLENEVREKENFHNQIDTLLKKLKSKKELSDNDIEKAARDLQNTIWLNRKIVWPDNIPDHPIKALNPGKILQKALAYKFAAVDQIENPENLELSIAGIINQNERVVMVSKVFDQNIRNFTAAHELGHALLHKQNIMHRDRPIDGSKFDMRKNLQEYQADKFSSYFLMPENIIRKVFYEIFGTNKFIINDESVFNFSKNSESDLRSECKNLRGLALKLASTERYRNNSFISIADLFKVSATAMAIRLEELDLIEF